MPCKVFGILWYGQNLSEVISERHSSDEKVDYGVRLLEIETAMAYSIQFDNTWYSIPAMTRATMIAGRLGRQWLASLQDEEVSVRIGTKNNV
jgi:hypothetical protein